MQPQPFVHSHSHSPAPHFAMIRLRRSSVETASINQVGRESQVLSSLAPRPPSLLPRNQVDRHADFWVARDRFEISAAISQGSASAHTPDVPWQLADCVEVALTVRECVRVLESRKHGS